MSTTTTTDNHSAPGLERYFSYLKLVADSQMNAKLRAKEDACDIVQETMLEAHRDFETFRGKSDTELRAWLRRILINNLISAARYHSRQKRIGQRELSLNSRLELSGGRQHYHFNSDPSFPGIKLVQQERSEKLANAFGQLLADEQTAVALKHFHARSVAEIAQHLGRTPEAVAGLLRRGLKKLRHHFKDEISAFHGIMW